jgi:hypothetical protein
MSNFNSHNLEFRLYFCTSMVTILLYLVGILPLGVSLVLCSTDCWPGVGKLALRNILILFAIVVRSGPLLTLLTDVDEKSTGLLYDSWSE